MAQIQAPKGWPVVLEAIPGIGKTTFMISLLKYYGKKGLTIPLGIIGRRERVEKIPSLPEFYVALANGDVMADALVSTQLEYMLHRYESYKNAVIQNDGLVVFDRALEFDVAFYQSMLEGGLITDEIYSALVTLNNFYCQKQQEICHYGTVIYLGTGDEETDKKGLELPTLAYERSLIRHRSIEQVEIEVPTGAGEVETPDTGGLTIGWEAELRDKYEATPLEEMERRGILKRMDFRDQIPTQRVTPGDYAHWRANYDNPNFDEDYVFGELPPSILEQVGIPELERLILG